MRRTWERSSIVLPRPVPSVRKSMGGPRTLEERVLPSTILAVFVALLAIQIALTL